MKANANDGAPIRFHRADRVTGFSREIQKSPFSGYDLRALIAAQRGRGSRSKMSLWPLAAWFGHQDIGFAPAALGTDGARAPIEHTDVGAVAPLGGIWLDPMQALHQTMKRTRAA
jgi:hypothetical protein